jgi:4-hydroxy-tetrahydrodipicolinate reductase
VHSDAKVGRDAGELCGLPTTGVLATNDADAILSLDADVVSYTATADLRPWQAVKDISRILESGKNVVSSSLVQLLHPPKADPAMVEELERACKAGGVSMFTSGIDPGFANDLLPIVLSGFCERVDHIRVQEILNYATYDQPEVLFDTMGFGKPLDDTPLLLFPGALSYAWGGVIHMLADALDVEVTEIRERHEKASLDHDVDIDLGIIEANTMAGLRFEVIGMVGGEERLVVEHVTRVHDDVAPDWPKGHGQGYYRIALIGSPSINVDLELVGEDGDHNTGGVLSTAMRILNAIPVVVDAPPGMLSTIDLPVTPGRHLMPQ